MDVVGGEVNGAVVCMATVTMEDVEMFEVGWWSGVWRRS
jgi:hypothetical protein